MCDRKHGPAISADSKTNDIDLGLLLIHFLSGFGAGAKMEVRSSRILEGRLECAELRVILLDPKSLGFTKMSEGQSEAKKGWW